MSETDRTHGETPTPAPDRPSAGELIFVVCWLSTVYVPVALTVRIAITLVVPGAGGPAWAAALIGVAAAVLLVWPASQLARSGDRRAERLFQICVALPLFIAFGATVAWFVATGLMTPQRSSHGASIWPAAPVGLVIGVLVTLLIIKRHGQLVEAMWYCSILWLLMYLLWPVLQEARARRSHRYHPVSAPADRRGSARDGPWPTGPR